MPNMIVATPIPLPIIIEGINHFIDILSVPAIKSPQRRSRIAVPNIIPGTSSIIAPIIMASTFNSLNKRCEIPATVAAKNDEMTVFAILLSLAE